MDSSTIIPTVPTVAIVLINFLAPYATALIVNPRWSKGAKKVVAVLVAIVLAVIVLAFMFYGLGIPIPAWPILILVAIVTSQASYDLLTKRSANALAAAAGTGSTR